MNDCHEERALLGAHLLGGLEDDETARLEAHLATCARCREERDRLASVVSLVTVAGPPDLAVLPEGFEDRLVAMAGRTRSRPNRVLPNRRRRFGRGRLEFGLGGALVGAAATVALLFAFGGLGGSSPGQPAALTVDLSPTAQAPNAWAVVYLINGKSSSTMALEAHGLPRPGPDQHYEVWFSDRSGAYSVGTIQVTPSGWSSAVLHSPAIVRVGSLVDISLVSKSGRRGGAYRPLVEGTVG
jgi:Anti-sigma-K factor rskA/Putative zinc-finger